MLGVGFRSGPGNPIEKDATLRSVAQRDLLADQAYEEIRDAIFVCKLPPGAALSVPDLARQLSISRSPVREAVQRLVHEGLAVTVPYRGAVVARIRSEDLHELYEVRELLEGLAARLATERLDRSALAELENIVERHQRVLDEERGLVAHVEWDMRFHRLVRELAGNAPLSEVLDTLQGRVRLAMYSLWHSDEAPRRALEEHKRILAAMSGGDPNAAEAAARAHITRVRTDLIRHMEQEEEKRS